MQWSFGNIVLYCRYGTLKAQINVQVWIGTTLPLPHGKKLPKSCVMGPRDCVERANDLTVAFFGSGTFGQELFTNSWWILSTRSSCSGLRQLSNLKVASRRSTVVLEVAVLKSIESWSHPSCILSWPHTKTAVVQAYSICTRNRRVFSSQAVGCQQESFRLPIMISSV